MLSSSLLLLSTAAGAQLLPSPESTPVALYGGAVRDAQSKLFGRGVALDDKKAVPPARVETGCGTSGSEVLWREVRREKDQEGNTHVFYRQFLVGEGLDAELVGSEIAVHTMPNGKLIGIGGRQFENVTVSGCPKTSAAQAIERASEKVLLHRGHYGRTFEPWTMSTTRNERLARTKLKLVQIDGTFRSAWFTDAMDAEDEPFNVVLDAEDDRLLAINAANLNGNCTPTTPESYVTAVGVPVRSEVTNWRTMKANVASRAGTEAYTHEGVWIPSDPALKHIVYHGVESTNGYACGYGSKAWTIFPLKVNSALSTSPIYDTAVSGYNFYGREAGDALYNAQKTMWAFKYMGRNSWDGAGGEVRIVVRSGTNEQGTFIQTEQYKGPANSVVIGAPVNMYSLAASLDLVAHEFAHGMIYTSAQFNTGTTQGLEFHEGFADVIAHAVEKRVQVSGTGVEQDSDYVMHEDSASSGYARGSLDDEADGITGHSWTGPNGSYTFNDRLHKNDPNYETTHIHATGNMLSVAYNIMAAGGSTDLPSGLNPICSRLTTLSGCEPSNAITFNERLGPQKGGDLLFYAVQYTLTSSSTWNDVADRVNEAAFAKYNQCSLGSQYNAAGEQNAVKKAFAGIGYPRTQPDITCP